jgi:hypothetical protein
MNVVRTTKGFTGTFEATTGVRQGCVFSSLLFSVYIDRVTKETHSGILKIPSEIEPEKYEQVNNSTIHCC